MTYTDALPFVITVGNSTGPSDEIAATTHFFTPAEAPGESTEGINAGTPGSEKDPEQFVLPDEPNTEAQADRDDAALSASSVDTEERVPGGETESSDKEHDG